MNEKIAFPALQVVCSDRIRTFCLNLGAFRAIAEYMQRETGREDYDISEFNWNSRDMKTLTILMWAGFFTDARKDEEPWTIEKCEEVLSILSLPEIETCISASIERVLTKEQITKMSRDAEKKTETPRKKRGRPAKVV